jgi:mannose-6-phosphate isomerase-like protein (cupin superfamily)
MHQDRTGFELERQPTAVLLARIIALYRANAADRCDGAAMLSRAAGLLDVLQLAQRPPACASLPVRRFLAGSSSNDCSGPLAAVSTAFLQAEPALSWVQNPNYTAERMGPDFVDRYGYVELVGPGRVFESRELLVGFLLLGPDTHYPDHNHAAEEVYHVVSGRARWRRGDGAWRTEPPGTIIHHPPHLPHAMRTDNEPLLALYCWMGDVMAPADLLRGDRYG